MEKERVGFLQEKPGSWSMTRLQMLLTLLFTFWITAYQVMNGEIDLTLITLLLTASVSPKLIQKFAEKK